MLIESESKPEETEAQQRTVKVLIELLGADRVRELDRAGEDLRFGVRPSPTAHRTKPFVVTIDPDGAMWPSGA